MSTKSKTLLKVNIDVKVKRSENISIVKDLSIDKIKCSFCNKEFKIKGIKIHQNQCISRQEHIISENKKKVKEDSQKVIKKIADDAQKKIEKAIKYSQIKRLPYEIEIFLHWVESKIQIHLSEQQIRIVEQIYASFTSVEKECCHKSLKDIKDLNKKSYNTDYSKFNYSNTIPDNYFTLWLYLAMRIECCKSYLKYNDCSQYISLLWKSFDNKQKNYITEKVDLVNKYQIAIKVL